VYPTAPIVTQYKNYASVVTPNPTGTWTTTYIDTKPSTVIPVGTQVKSLPANIAAAVKASTNPLTQVSPIAQAIAKVATTVKTVTPSVVVKPSIPLSSISLKNAIITNKGTVATIPVTFNTRTSGVNSIGGR
jgi:hypothetical protein